MTETALPNARTPMGGAGPRGAEGATLSEAPLRGMITVKTDLGNPSVAAALTALLDVEIPATRRLVEGADGVAVLWMAPDELMLFDAYDSAPNRASALSALLIDAPHLVEVVSDARQIFTLEGPGAREVLAKGAPVDFRPTGFTVGEVRRTRISTVAAGIALRAAHPDVFEIFCFRSYAPYLWRWLSDAAETPRPGVLTRD